MFVEISLAKDAHFEIGSAKVFPFYKTFQSPEWSNDWIKKCFWICCHQIRSGISRSVWGPILLNSSNTTKSKLSAPQASTPVKNKPSEDVPGRKECQQGSQVISSASPVVFKFHYITVFLLFPGGIFPSKKLFPSRNFKVHRVTWPGCLYSPGPKCDSVLDTNVIRCQT